MLATATFARLVGRTSRIIPHTIDSSMETAEEKEMRKAYANQMVVTLMDLLSLDTKQRDSIICSASEEWDKWFGVSSQRLRSTLESRPRTLCID